MELTTTVVASHHIARGVVQTWLQGSSSESGACGRWVQARSKRFAGSLRSTSESTRGRGCLEKYGGVGRNAAAITLGDMSLSLKVARVFYSFFLSRYVYSQNPITPVSDIQGLPYLLHHGELLSKG